MRKACFALSLGLFACAAACGGDDNNAGAAADGGAESTSPDATPGASDAALTAVSMRRADLVADVAGRGAAHVDAKLLNPWGLAFNPGGFAWVADNHAGVATVYDLTGAPLSAGSPPAPLVVTIPSPAGGAPPSAPSGQVLNDVATDFKGDSFIFDTEDGTVSGWQTACGATATLRADESSGGALYKGIAIAGAPGSRTLLAANFGAGRVDVFDSSYALVPGAHFVDPTIPAEYAPFNVATLDGDVYVAYAKQNGDGDDAPGPGNGYVSVFDATGTFKKRLVSGGPLNAPWALAKAPAGFGSMGGMILVGNFGDGTIVGVDPQSGDVRAQVTNAAGQPLQIDGLWALTFFTPSGSTTPSLYFTAGPVGETDGAFGRLDLSP